jgi:carboxypeptidase PM20D1
MESRDAILTQTPALQANTITALDLERAQRLSGALQFQTISFLEKEKIKTNTLLAFHTYLEETFRRVHAGLKREVVNGYSLLYTWQGTRPDLKPVLLMAHIDVVPVEPGTEEHWRYPPFEGRIEEKAIWGRGALDCKGSLMAILEAVEQSLAEGFQPARTIYLAFGHDEEIGGIEGAKQISSLLQSRNVELEAVLDEGLAVIEGVVKLVAQPIAMVGIAEKGYVTLELCSQSESGHSSTPPKETAIGILSQAVLRLERNPMPPRLGDIPKRMFSKLRPGMKPLLRFLFRFQRILKPVIIWQLSYAPTTNALVRTTTAVTIFQAGSKDNVLPHQARAAVNFRILPGDRVQDVIDHAKKVINDPRIEILAKQDFSMEPSPVSEMDSKSFSRLEKAISSSFTDAIVSPGLVLGGTDCRHYVPLSRCCYRFSPIRLNPSDLRRVHGTDERMTVENYAQAVAFYQTLIAEWGKA